MSRRKKKLYAPKFQSWRGKGQAVRMHKALEDRVAPVAVYSVLGRSASISYPVHLSKSGKPPWNS